MENVTELAWAERIQPQPMFDVLARAKMQEQSGAYVARMEIGDTPGFQNLEIQKLISKYVKEPLRYSPSSGELALIDAVQRTQWGNYSESEFKISIAPANFLITAAIASVSKPGDTIYLPDPGFPTYVLAANFLNLRIIKYRSFGNIKNEIETRISETRMKPAILIINNPSNPLGLANPGKEFVETISFLEKQNTKIIIDETYVNLVYDGTDSEILSESAIRIRSFSKEHCSPGLRVGYCLAPKASAKVIADFISLSISCSPKFIQLAVAEYLESKHSGIFAQMVRTEMKRRFESLRSLVPISSLLVSPNAAFYALIKVKDDMRAFEFLMNRNVSTCPGSKFGDSSKDTLRISLAGSQDTFNTDIEMFAKALHEYKSEYSS